MRFAHGHRSGIPAMPGLALNSARLPEGARNTSFPFYLHLIGILPMDGKIVTSVCRAESASATTSTPSRVVCRAE